eukprot:2607-Heterococcus_DN1.PRE.10
MQLLDQSCSLSMYMHSRAEQVSHTVSTHAMFMRHHHLCCQLGALQRRPACTCSYVVGSSLSTGQTAADGARDRDRSASALQNFRSGKLQLLVTTDACSEVSCAAAYSLTTSSALHAM